MSQILEQGILLLDSLSDQQYVQPIPEAFSSGIGGHYRHSLEHFLPLLHNEQIDVIDYDARARDRQIETDRAFALQATRDCLDKVKQLQTGNLNRTVQVRCSVCEDAESPLVPSSFSREIMYAVIHAVHHYALIRVMCNLLDVPQPEGFGMAPSTLRYQKS
jgi:hypothetical protein